MKGIPLKYWGPVGYTADVNIKAYHTYRNEGAMALGKQIAVESILAIPMVGGIGKGAKVAKGVHSAYLASNLFQVVRTVARPITSTMTRLGYSSVPEKLVTRYGYAKYGVGLLDPLATTRALSRGDYDEAIIGFYGPPGTVSLYRKVLESLASSSSPSQQNGGAKGKTNGHSDTRGLEKSVRKYSKDLSRCPSGHYWSSRKNKCVRYKKRR